MMADMPDGSLMVGETLPAGTPDSNNRTEEVYQALRRDILLGRLRPNEPLVETDLAERLQVSRTPIRNSLLRLAAEGLIVSRRRRWMVYEYRKDEIREVYEVRMAQEGFAARLACERATDEEIADIERQYLAEWRPREQGDSSMVNSNNLFHARIVAAAHNRRLGDLIERNRVFFFNNQVALLYGPDDTETSHGQHLQLIEALQRRDPDTAERATRNHIQHALTLIMDRLI
jgi:DNA-binding GntR family transcriptional regulator